MIIIVLEAWASLIIIVLKAQASCNNYNCTRGQMAHWTKVTYEATFINVLCQKVLFI